MSTTLRHPRKPLRRLPNGQLPPRLPERVLTTAVLLVCCAAVVVPFIAIGIVLALALSHSLNAVALGDDGNLFPEALHRSLGERQRRARSIGITAKSNAPTSTSGSVPVWTAAARAAIAGGRPGRPVAPGGPILGA